MECLNTIKCSERIYISERHNPILNSIETKGYRYINVDNIGTYSINSDYFTHHINAIKALPVINTEAIARRKFKVVVDTVNSTGGIVVPLLLNSLGIEEIELINCNLQANLHKIRNPLQRT